MPKKKGTSILGSLKGAMSGAGPRRDKKLLDAEMKALGISDSDYYSKGKKKKK